MSCCWKKTRIKTAHRSVHVLLENNRRTKEASWMSGETSSRTETSPVAYDTAPRSFEDISSCFQSSFLWQESSDCVKLRHELSSSLSLSYHLSNNFLTQSFPWRHIGSQQTASNTLNRKKWVMLRSVCACSPGERQTFQGQQHYEYPLTSTYTWGVRALPPCLFSPLSTHTRTEVVHVGVSLQGKLKIKC